MDDGLRWSGPEQRHLTLQFLGRVADADALVESVTESVQPRAPFVVALGGGGAFPSARRASVLWIGVHEGGDGLTSLAGAVADATVPLGFAVDDRPYRPHLTVARSARARDLRGVVDELAVEPSPAWTVDEMVLFDSDTRADGAVHTERARFALGIG